jgi:hypothetical protein
MARAEDIVKIGSGAVFIWRFLPEDGTPATFIHQCFRQEVWRQSDWRQKLLLCGALLAWPVLLPAAMAFFTWRNGSDVRRRTGKGLFRQMGEQLRLAIRCSMLPPWYYIFELHDDARRSRAREYINRFETKRFMYPFLREHNGGLPVPAMRSTLFLSDKAQFAMRCAEHGLPAVPALMVLENGRVVHSEGDAAALPKLDLFVKLLRGTGGRHAERWEYLGSDRYRDAGGTIATEAVLLQHLKQLTLDRRKGCIVLPRLVNHPEIADLTNGALSTARVVTCRDERGGYEVTNAAFRMAQGKNSIVDNFHAGGIVAKIDIRTGEVGRATDGAMALGPGIGWCERHPDTGGQILGRKLPYWQDVLDLARRAHTLAFPDEVVIGWDIGILSDGPRLIEGNKGPDVDLVQRSHGEPLGNARLGQLLAFNLKRTLDAKYGTTAERTTSRL